MELQLSINCVWFQIILSLVEAHNTRINVQFAVLLYFADFHPSCPHTHISVTPLCHHSDNVYVLHEKTDSTAEEKGDVPAEKRKDHSIVSQPQQQEIYLSSARSPFQGNTSSLALAGSNLSVAINRKRIFSLEPFHQSSIVSGRQKREREQEREEEDNSGTPAKKAKLNKRKLPKVVFQRFYRWNILHELHSDISLITQLTSVNHAFPAWWSVLAYFCWLPVVFCPTSDSTLEDVKKLKVCIELNGLRLKKSLLAGELQQWLPSGLRSADVDRKFRTDVPVIGGRAEVSGVWQNPTPVKRNDPKGNIFRIYPVR